eukprot:7258530-Lingulodinium_polyedra.AAC.1
MPATFETLFEVARVGASRQRVVSAAAEGTALANDDIIVTLRPVVMGPNDEPFVNLRTAPGATTTVLRELVARISS